MEISYGRERGSMSQKKKRKEKTPAHAYAYAYAYAYANLWPIKAKWPIKQLSLLS
jgi:hypothetical protein